MTTSIIILTVNQLTVTQQCLESIRQNTPETYELIVLDNGSTDGTVEYLKSQADIKSVFNSCNPGFAKGYNQGIELASGDNILFLNNGTVVTEHWLGNMLRLLDSQPQIGLVGPVSNKAGGYQQINVSYADHSGLVDFAREHCAKNAGLYRRVFRLAGFCLLAKKEVINQVGGFDELFSLGTSKDDDFCLRAVRVGYHLMIAYDAFVHHMDQGALNSVGEGSLKKQVEENQEKAIAKWGFNIRNYLDNLQTIIESEEKSTAPKIDLPSYESRLEVGEKLASQELYCFANELLNRCQYEQAIEFYEKFLATSQGEVEDKITACGKAADIYLKLGDKESMNKYIFRSFLYDTPRAEFCCRLGFLALEEEDYQSAIVWYRIAAQLEMPTENLNPDSNNSCWTWLPHLQLAVCYDRLGKLELGYLHNEFARNFLPQDNRVQYNRTYFKNFLGPRKTAEIDAQVLAELRRKKLLSPEGKSDFTPGYWENRKIFLGCGNLKLDEFVNVDNYQTSATEVILDWEHPLPFREAKIKCVFSNSFLEHFERGKIDGHLKEVYATLRDDGYFCYIGLPYFRNIASFYLENSPGTNGPLFNLQNVFQYTHGVADYAEESSIDGYQRHKSLFDEAELHALLRAAGVQNYLLFVYAFPGDENELPVLSGFYAEKSGDFTETSLKAACQSFLSQFDGKLIRLNTLAYLSCVIGGSQVSTGRGNRPQRFVTMFPGAENFHMVKGVGMIPFMLHKYYGYESFVACYNNGPYDYLRDEVKGLQTWFIDRVTGNVEKDGNEFLRAHAQEIDVLNVLHLIDESFIWASVYKALNPTGKVFLKLDANDNILKANWHNAKEIFRDFDLISVETIGYQDFLRKAWSIDVERLPTGFYDGEKREIVDFSSKENVILTVGRIGADEKANHILVEAFKIAADLLPEWKVKLVGTVTEQFEHYVSELLTEKPELRDRIILTGHLSDRKMLREEYKKAKVFCLTSLWEGFPNVFPEAQQNGCFIISSDLSPAWDITDNKRLGDIFPINDVKSLADSLLRNCKDEEILRRVCREAQDYAYENFNWVEICGRLDNLLK